VVDVVVHPVNMIRGVGSRARDDCEEEKILSPDAQAAVDAALAYQAAIHQRELETAHGARTRSPPAQPPLRSAWDRTLVGGGKSCLE
jgi:hypothetical protein